MMKTFPPSEIRFEKFVPKWWAVNAHVHTIAASKLTKVENCSPVRVEIETPDDDFVEADILESLTDQPIVALFHGLEGSTERHYIRNLMHMLYESGFSCAALNFRGCGGKMNLQPRFYHSGDSESYDFFIQWLAEEYPDKEIYAIGYSLGANALVKYLGEQKGESKIQKAVAVSPPFDLRSGSVGLQRGFNRIYEKYFLKSLVEKLNEKRMKHPELPEFHGKTLYDFDDQVTAPLHGFKDAEDYYEQCSSKHFYKDVKIPLLVIHSKDDPICPIEFAPNEDIENNVNIHFLLTESGGHVGFLSELPGWLNRVILDSMGEL